MYKLTACVWISSNIEEATPVLNAKVDIEWRTKDDNPIDPREFEITEAEEAGGNKKKGI